ncbi:condensation domain-containing protein [Phytohabitans flavus]|uniref:condensation domain-containing protein n=1 Tax=Phytohabitans flavus TaxID=1076124 RepID=UPI0036276676
MVIQLDGLGTVRLTPRPAVPARFSGGQDAQGPYTLGQLNIKVWLDQSPDHCYSTLKWTLDVPVGTTVQEAAAAVSTLVTWHEGLRTRYLGGDPPVQRVAGSGELPIEVWSVDEGQAGPVDPALLAHELLARLASGIAPDAPLPLRVAVAVRGELVRAAVMVFSHLAVDFQAVTVLGREFTALLRDPRRPAAGIHQPLAQAAAESDPRARRRQEAAIRHWERHLRLIPQCLYARPRTGPSAGGGIGQLSSPAGAAALRHIASRTRTSRPTIVFAALCAVLARRTGYSECRFPILSGNRFEPRLEQYVGTLAQSVLVRLDTGGATFDELVRRAFATLLSASRNGAWDATVAARLHERVAAERGLHLRFEPLFNNLVVDSPRPARRPSRSSRWPARRPVRGWCGSRRRPCRRWSALTCGRWMACSGSAAGAPTPGGWIKPRGVAAARGRAAAAGGGRRRPGRGSRGPRHRPRSDRPRAGLGARRLLLDRA